MIWLRSGLPSFVPWIQIFKGSYRPGGKSLYFRISFLLALICFFKALIIWHPLSIWLSFSFVCFSSLKCKLHKARIYVYFGPFYKTRQCVKKQRHHFSNKGPYSQGYGLSSSYVQMWELDSKESRAPKNWCFWTVVLEKTLKESPGLQGDQTSQS